MIRSAVHAASDDDDAIYLHPGPTTREDAIRNLQQFSDEGRQKGRFRDLPGAVQVTAKTMPRLRRCYGWTTVSPTDIARAIRRGLPRFFVASDVPRTISPGTVDRNAIVYEYIPDHKTEELATQDAMDFLWRAGFQLTSPTRLEDWRNGVLLDFAAMRCPWHPGYIPIGITRSKFDHLA